MKKILKANNFQAKLQLNSAKEKKKMGAQE